MAVNESGAAISSAGCEVSFPDRDAGCTGVSHFACRDSTVLDSNGAKLKEVGDSAAFDFQRIRVASPVNEYMHDQPDYEDERANDNVPGASASTIRIQSLWHCFPRKVFDAGTDFSRFFRAMHMKPQGREKSPSTVAIWPMPLPYHPQFDFGKNIDAGEIALRKAVNLQIACLDFLHLRKQSSPPFEICGAVQLNGGQLEVVRRFRRLVAAWQNHPAIGPEELGRTAGKQERQEQLLSSLESFAEPVVGGFKKYAKNSGPVRSFRQCDAKGKVIGSVKGSNLCSAQQIVASRIKMEGKPSFNPLPFLDDEAKALYSDPFVCGIQPHDVDPAPPRVRVHADDKEKIDLLHLLESSGRLGFNAPSQIVSGFGNGLFCVPKSTKVDRLILDGRPANLLQVPPMKYIMTMAAATTLMGIYLSPQEKLLMTGDDLSNFFYTFEVGEQRVGRNFLEWKIPIHIARQFRSFPIELLNEKYVYIYEVWQWEILLHAVTHKHRTFVWGLHAVLFQKMSW